MIRLVPAKCPNCGASIEVDQDSKRAKCEYCKGDIIVEDAIQKVKVEHSGKVEVEGIESAKTHLTKAKKYLKLNEYDKAYTETDLAYRMDELEPEIYGIRTIIKHHYISSLDVKNEVKELNGSFFEKIPELKTNYDKYLKLNEIEENKKDIIQDIEKEVKDYINLYEEHKEEYFTLKDFNTQYRSYLNSAKYDSKERVKNEFITPDIRVDQLTNSIVTADNTLKSTYTNEVIFDFKPKYISLEKTKEAFHTAVENENKVLAEIRREAEQKQKEADRIAEAKRIKNKKIDEEIFKINQKRFRDNLVPNLIGLVILIIIIVGEFLVFNSTAQSTAGGDDVMYKEFLMMIGSAIVSWIIAYIICVSSKSDGSFFAGAGLIGIITYIGSYIGVAIVDVATGAAKKRIILFIISLILNLFVAIVPTLISLIDGVIVVGIVKSIVNLLTDIKTNSKIKKLNKQKES